MRISSQQIFSGGVNRLQDLNTQLQKTQQQVSTGKRVINPSDDPVAAARLLKLDQQSAQIDQFQRGIDLATNRLQQEESTLGDVTDVIQRVRELTVQAGNGTLSAEDRDSIASELRERLDQLASLANTRDASGEYIFSGFKGNTQAYQQNVSGSWVYQGDEGQRELEIDVGVKVAISDHGKGIFSDVASNNPTFFTEASSANSTNPPATISTGMMLDQEVFNSVYPDDLVVEVDATAGTYTVTNRSTGADLTPADNTYTSGDSIQVAGMQFEITGASDGDKFFVKTSDRQSMFSTVEKLIYGLENQAKTPATATISDFSAQAGGDSVSINGVTFSFDNTDDLQSVADAINSSTDPALEGVSVNTDDLPGSISLESTQGDLEIDAGGWGGDLEISGAKFQDIDINGSVVQPDSADAATFPSGQQAFNDLIADSLENLDNAQESVLTTQTQIGGRLNAVESTSEFLTDSSVYNEQITSELRDVDYAEAISRLSFQSFVLQAAQQSFAQVSQLSLFDRL
ncbi:flagellar hook-associated protein FlgL [Marinobacter bohaiensis]|uniref:flagellar hook-associated protein FlgL n=1 Tax=Marinobacter bohaiensis TaxID=2201898 RepID=UPI000DACE02E|nr:flagellar hook-associated protein FlgL [Marinobacter bohaiensis]